MGKSNLEKRGKLKVKWAGTGVVGVCRNLQNVWLSASWSKSALLERALQERLNSIIYYPAEFVRDTLQKPTCPAVDPSVQLEPMIYRNWTPGGDQCAHHMTMDDSEAHFSGRERHEKAQTAAADGLWASNSLEKWIKYLNSVNFTSTECLATEAL